VSAFVKLEFVGPSGASWNVHLARLPSGGLFVHSPAWLGDDTFAQIEKHGTPEVLFAPNAYHHVSLEKFRAKWPAAMACASAHSLPRLTKKGHPNLRDASEAPLPANGKLIVAEHADETFLKVGDELLFCDGFLNFTRPITGFVGLVMRLFHVSGGLTIGTPFKHFGIPDRAKYKQWLFAMLDREQPKTVHFSHGDPISGPDVIQQLKAVANRRL
jgi:hypothetical protein